MKTEYLIFDWSGNRIAPDKVFPSFEEGWHYIQGELTDRLSLTENDYQEFFVYEKPNNNKE